MATAPRHRDLWHWGWVALLGALALVVWGGCGSTPEERYRVLSFFFDGVPLPPSMMPESQLVGGEALGPMIYHAPYEEQACNACHKRAGKFSTTFSGFRGVNTDVCFECHAEVKTKHDQLHGPVAVNACLFCHDAHQSRIPHLLRQVPTALCAQCHDQDLMLSSEVPAHQDPERNCLDCHYGHGGADRFFLRPDPIEPEEVPDLESTEPVEGTPDATEALDEGAG